MSPNPRRDASFVIRIWWERGVEDRVRWRGRVVHASNRQSAYFEAIPVLVKFLEQWTGDLSNQSEETGTVYLEQSLEEDNCSA
jgi:hypothetical protein